MSVLETVDRLGRQWIVGGMHSHKAARVMAIVGHMIMSTYLHCMILLNTETSLQTIRDMWNKLIPKVESEVAIVLLSPVWRKCHYILNVNNGFTVYSDGHTRHNIVHTRAWLEAMKVNLRCNHNIYKYKNQSNKLGNEVGMEAPKSTRTRIWSSRDYNHR